MLVPPRRRGGMLARSLVNALFDDLELLVLSVRHQVYMEIQRSSSGTLRDSHAVSCRPLGFAGPRNGVQLAVRD